MRSRGLLVVGLGAAALYLAVTSSSTAHGGVGSGGSGGGGGGGGGGTSDEPDDWPQAGFNSSGKGDGLDLASRLPPGPTQDRDDAIYDLVRSGYANIQWTQISFTKGGLTCTCYAMARTLRVGATNPVRVSVNYETMQRIADKIGACMMTRRIADRTRAASDLALQPVTEPWFADGTMGNTDRLVQYSQTLDGKVPVEDAGFVSNESKHWINTLQFWQAPLQLGVNAQGMLVSCNYGWWTSQAPNPKGPFRGFGEGQPSDQAVWQPASTTHNWKHVDYSQQIVLVAKAVSFSGALNGTCHIGNVLKDQNISDLLSDEGPLPLWKHPGFGDAEVDAKWQDFLDQGLPSS